MPQCIVKNCKNRTIWRRICGERKKENIYVNNISFHRFPKNKKVKQLWLDILELESVSNEVRICSAHFTKDDFNFSSGTKRLRPNAMPYKDCVVTDVPINDEVIASSNTTNQLLSANAIFKIDRATSPISECSYFVDQSTSMSSKRTHNSFKEEYFHQKLQDIKNAYVKKIKVLQQKIRRKDSKIISLEAIIMYNNNVCNGQ